MLERNTMKEILDEKGIKMNMVSRKTYKRFNTINVFVCDCKRPNLDVLNEIVDVYCI